MTGVIFASVFVVGASASQASTAVTNDFNTEAQVADNFNAYISSGTVGWGATGGLFGTGALNTDSNPVFGVFATKSTYSVGPVGSTYAMSAYVNSVGNSGYSGIGFTALTPSASADNGSLGVFRPTDALGVSVNDGGYVFHNGTTDQSGTWTPGGDLISSGWYKIELIITRATETTFNMKLSLWAARSDGVLGSVDPAGVFELNNQASPMLLEAHAISSYINFSGYCITNVDAFSVNLAGGSSVIEPGTPVVLTNNATETAGVVTATGEVTADGDASVTERGFALGTVSEPTISDSTIVAGTGVGIFTGMSSALSDGTYFIRAYATNSVGTSYGAEQELTITDGVAAPAVEKTSLAATGASSSAIVLASLLALVFATWGIALLAISRRRARSSAQNR